MLLTVIACARCARPYWLEHAGAAHSGIGEYLLYVFYLTWIFILFLTYFQVAWLYYLVSVSSNDSLIVVLVFT